MCLVAALTIGIILLTISPRGDVDDEPRPTPALIEHRPDLLVVDFENVSEVFFTPQDGAAYSLIIDRELGELVLDAQDVIFPGDQSVMEFVLFGALSLTNLTRITEDADDEVLALFGLDNPRMKWQIRYLNGETADLALGSELPTGEGSYIRSLDSRDVFIIGMMQTSSLVMSLDEVYDISFVPFPPSTEELPTWELIQHMLLESPDGDIIEIHRRSPEELEIAPTGSSRFKMLQPFYAECNDFMVRSVILETITGFLPDQVISKRPVDLSVYGLDNPYRLTVTVPIRLNEDWVGTLLIGNYDNGQDGRFVMIEGYDAVLLDRIGVYDFLDVYPFQLQSRIVWLHVIGTVSSVEFYLDGVDRELKLEHDNGDIRGWLDDVELSADNARRLYTSALNLIIGGLTFAPIPDTSPDYAITINFIDGDSEIVELYGLNDAQFLIVQNGASMAAYITRLMLTQNLLDRFVILDAGGDLPRM
jgi:hypothetical protein